MSPVLSSVVAHRVFAWEMAKRDLQIANKGAVLGLVWLIVKPFIQVMP